MYVLDSALIIEFWIKRFIRLPDRNFHCKQHTEQPQLIALPCDNYKVYSLHVLTHLGLTARF